VNITVSRLSTHTAATVHLAQERIKKEKKNEKESMKKLKIVMKII
jgi:hypothetical protein